MDEDQIAEVMHLVHAYGVACRSQPLRDQHKAFNKVQYKLLDIMESDDPDEGLEHCDRCGAVLQESQIGLCDCCQEDAEESCK